MTQSREQPTVTMAQQVAQAASPFQQQWTGHAPKAVTVVLAEDTLVIMRGSGAEIEPSTGRVVQLFTSGTMVQVFASGTMVQVFLLAHGLPTGAWDGTGPGDPLKAPHPEPLYARENFFVEAKWAGRGHGGRRPYP